MTRAGAAADGGGRKGSIVCRCITSMHRSDGNALHGRPGSFPGKGRSGRAFGLTVAWEKPGTSALSSIVGPCKTRV
jgi:hypothetical protein